MEHKGTGRTSRMLAFALATAKAKKNVVIYGKDVQHTLMLCHQFDKQYARTKKQRDAKWRARVHFSPFSELTRADNVPFQRGYDRWNDSKGAVKPGTKIVARNVEPTTPIVHLVDHFALEARLAKITHYLEQASRLNDSALWIVQTAKMLVSTGKQVTVVTDDPQITTDLIGNFGIRLADLGKPKLDWTNLRFTGPVDDPRIILFDPQTLEDHFIGTIKEINRWNT